jgi:hypothetical protein
MGLHNFSHFANLARFLYVEGKFLGMSGGATETHPEASTKSLHLALS